MSPSHSRSSSLRLKRRLFFHRSRPETDGCCFRSLSSAVAPRSAGSDAVSAIKPAVEIAEPRRDEFSRISAIRAECALAFISRSASSVCGCSESATQKPLRKVSVGRSSMGASSFPASAQVVGAFSPSAGSPVVDGRRGDACQRAAPIFMWCAASVLT
eukprot:scaffold129699_cov48-Phaeocystis_antarctica.AAC.4